MDRVVDDVIIARRRPPEDESEIILTAESTWVHNKWCDVLSVGHGHWCPDMENQDGSRGGYAHLGVDVGDVAFIIQYHGTKMAPITDPRLISIHCHQIEEAGDTVWAIQKSKRFKDSASGETFRGGPVFQRMDVRVPDGEIPISKGDYLLTNKYGVHRVVRRDDFDSQYVEVPDEGRFGQ